MISHRLENHDNTVYFAEGSSVLMVRHCIWNDHKIQPIKKIEHFEQTFGKYVLNTGNNLLLESSITKLFATKFLKNIIPRLREKEMEKKSSQVN